MFARRTLLTTALASGMALAAGGLAFAQDKAPVRIAAIAPLSGPGAFDGQLAVEGMKAMAAVINDKGGVLGEYGLSEEQGNEIIMAARAHWFDDEPAAEAEAQTGEAADADPAQ